MVEEPCAGFLVCVLGTSFSRALWLTDWLPDCECVTGAADYIFKLCVMGFVAVRRMCDERYGKHMRGKDVDNVFVKRLKEESN